MPASAAASSHVRHRRSCFDSSTRNIDALDEVEEDVSRVSRWGTSAWTRIPPLTRAAFTSAAPGPSASVTSMIAGPAPPAATNETVQPLGTARALPSSTVIRTRSVVPRRVPGGPSPRCPRAITPTRSHVASTSAKRWLEMKIVVPPSASRAGLADLPDPGRIEPVRRFVQVRSSGSPEERQPDPEP